MGRVEVFQTHELESDLALRLYWIEKVAVEAAFKTGLNIDGYTGIFEEFYESLKNPNILVGDRNNPDQQYGGLRQTPEGPKDGLWLAVAYAGEEPIGWGGSRLNMSWNPEGNAAREKALKTATVVKKYLEIFGLYVDPIYQKHGVGRDLEGSLLGGINPARPLNPLRSVAEYVYPDVYKPGGLDVEARAQRRGMVRTGESFKKIFGPNSVPTRQVRYEASPRQFIKTGGKSALNAHGIRRRLNR